MRPPLPLSSVAGKTPIAWSIAGFDPSSGAGVTADLMTFAAHGVFGCSAITALTVQTTVGVFGLEATSAAVLKATMERLLEDLPPAGIKVGMLATAENVAVLADSLEGLDRFGEERPCIVLDPVLRSSSGRELLNGEGVHLLRERLLPLVHWITPNWAELALLSGAPVRSVEQARYAGNVLAKQFPQLQIVVTGGDQAEPLDLVLLPEKAPIALPGKHVKTSSTHGTGCAFSSALLANLVHGASPVEAVQAAKSYVRAALLRAPGLGKGKGPLGLLWPLQTGAGDQKGLVP